MTLLHSEPMLTNRLTLQGQCDASRNRRANCKVRARGGLWNMSLIINDHENGTREKIEGAYP